MKNVKENARRKAVRVLGMVGSIGLISLLSAACSVTDPGDGSNTLSVQAELVYNAGDNLSRVTVSVKNKSGVLVSDADVALETESGRVIRIPSDEYSPGYYRQIIRGYENVLRLIVRKGEDDRLDATLEGPGRHAIVNPLSDYVMDTHDERVLVAKWKDEEEGEVAEVEVSTRQFNEVFEKNIKSLRFKKDDLLKGREKLEVMRSNYVELDGGIAGSRFTMKYIASNEFTVD